MAAVRSLRVSVKPDSGSDSDSESDKDAREAEPMEVEDGELEDEVSVSRSLKELLPPGTRVSCSPGERERGVGLSSRRLPAFSPRAGGSLYTARPNSTEETDTSRRYENKAGSFITGIDVNSKEAIERKEKRAQRFHFRPEDNAEQRDVLMDKETMKKAIPNLRMEALYVTGVDDMSTQDIFGYFKEYPPAHIEWIDDNSCNVVWLDDNTSIRALVNCSRLPDPETVTTETESSEQPETESK
ncbi:hypothetical protein NQZ68_033103, partial [Dissostichus eleginoides]